LRKWSTPNPKVQYFHGNKCDGDIDGGRDDNLMLRKDHGHTIVHYEQAGFDQPYCKELHLLYHQHELGSVCAHLDFSL
jgi:hypothetical protein